MEASYSGLMDTHLEGYQSDFFNKGGVVKYWNHFLFAETSVPEQLPFERQLDTYIYPKFCSLVYFRRSMTFLGQSILYQSLKTYIHTQRLANAINR